LNYRIIAQQGVTPERQGKALASRWARHAQEWLKSVAILDRLSSARRSTKMTLTLFYASGIAILL
jgi:hypothetical protein